MLDSKDIGAAGVRGARSRTDYPCSGNASICRGREFDLVVTEGAIITTSLDVTPGRSTRMHGHSR
jgi:hypothetical protein